MRYYITWIDQLVSRLMEVLYLYEMTKLIIDIYTGPLKKLFHYALFQKFFPIFIFHISGLCFTCLYHFVSINHLNL